MRELGFKVAFAVAVAAGLWVAGFTGFKALTGRPVTAAHPMRWLAEGVELEPSAAPVCDGDPQFRTLVRDDALWSSCRPGSGAPFGAYVRLRPSSGVVELSWPLPESLPLVKTEGLRPGPGGQLAIVYRTAGGGLAAAIASEEGWQQPPRELTASPTAQLLGVDWQGLSVEVVWAPTPSLEQTDGWNDPRIETLHADGTRSTRALPRELICDARWLQCGVQAAYRQPGAAVWRLLVSMREPAGLWTVVETGIRHRVDGFDFPWDARDDTDLTASGLLIEAVLRLRGVFTAQGEFRRLAGDVVAQYAGWSHDYEASEGALGLRSHYAMGGTTVFLEEPDGATVGVELSRERRDLIVAYRLQGGQVIAQSRVGRLTPDCRDLAAGALVSDSAGGFWLVSGSGCQLRLAGDMTRLDPLSLVAHLQAGGSACSRCAYLGPVAALVWVLLGLPISIGAGAGLVLWRRRARPRMIKEPIYTVLILPALFFDVSAALLLIDLLPMLG